MFLLKEHPKTTQKWDGKLQPGDIKITMTRAGHQLLEGRLRHPISNPPSLTHSGLYSDTAETDSEAADLFSAQDVLSGGHAWHRTGPCPCHSTTVTPTSPSASYLDGLPSTALLCAAHWATPSTSHTTSSKTNFKNTTTRATREVFQPDRVTHSSEQKKHSEGKHTFKLLRPPLRRVA